MTDTSTLDKKSAKLHSEYEVVTELMRKCVEKNAHSALEQNEYQKLYSSLVERYENIKKEIGEIDDERLELNAKRKNIETFYSDVGTKRQPYLYRTSMRTSGLRRSILLRYIQNRILHFYLRTVWSFLGR